jgi:hypothetical protein
VALGYIRPVKPARPGIARANRPRRGPFSSLLDQVLHDQTALDGLAYAYTELGPPERHALVRAVLQDATDPTRALAALLAVEEEPSAQQRLATLIQRHGRTERAVFLTGTGDRGEARLVQRLPSLGHELLFISWKESKVEDIHIEPRHNLRIDDPEPSLPVSKAVETLAPLLWQHIRAGGQLPKGIERFAGFFSGAGSP